MLFDLSEAIMKSNPLSMLTVVSPKSSSRGQTLIDVISCFLFSFFFLHITTIVLLRVNTLCIDTLFFSHIYLH